MATATVTSESSASRAVRIWIDPSTLEGITPIHICVERSLAKSTPEFVGKLTGSVATTANPQQHQPPVRFYRTFPMR